MRTTRIEVIINVLFWLASAWLIGSSFSIETIEIENLNGIEKVRILRNKSLIFQLMGLVNLCSCMFYVNLFAITRNVKNKRSLLTFSLATILAFLLVLALLHSLTLLGRPGLSIHLIVGISFFYYAISLAYGLGKIWLKADENQRNLQLEKQQYQLTLLRNQLQPHFLFNALNNLLSMVNQAENKSLAVAIDKLSSLLRHVVEESSAAEVPLKKEIQFIRDYADLQLLRFETNEVRYQLTCDGNPEYHSVEPGLFISIIENAFKYGTRPEASSDIKIHFDVQQSGKTILTVSNPLYPSQGQEKGLETGLLNLKKRLELVYPQRHQLVIDAKERFTIKLEIEAYESYRS